VFVVGIGNFDRSKSRSRRLEHKSYGLVPVRLSYHQSVTCDVCVFEDGYDKAIGPDAGASHLDVACTDASFGVVYPSGRLRKVRGFRFRT